MSNVIRSWNNFIIRFRKSDNFGCLTDMANASNKNFGHWMENKSTKAYLEALSGAIGKPITDLLQVVQGGIPENQGTWAERKICIRFAQWCSAEFAVQVDMWVEEFMDNGKMEFKPLSPAEMFLYSAQKLVEIEQKQAQLENEQALLRAQVSLEAQRTNDLEDLVTQHDAELDRIFNSNGHYFTIMGYCALKGKPIAVKAASQLGKKASKLCRQQGFPVAPVKDPRFGTVNSYPESVLAQII